ncbi:MAG: ATP-binding protein [Desulfococcaceae bacterium]|nr:ATP-binding protein [Desulfococcaceae bacterium]
MKKKHKYSVLIVDDEKENLTSFKYLFEDYYDIYTAESADEGFEIITKNEIHVVISDQRMPNITGVEFLEKVLHAFPNTVRMILTGYSDIDAVINAINKGKVYYFFSKPWDDYEMKLIIDNALEAIALKKQLKTQEERYRATFEQAGVGIAHLDARGNFLKVNHQYCSISDYSETELLSMTVCELIQNDADAVRADIQKILADPGRIIKNEKKILTKHQCPVWIRMTLSLLQHPEEDKNYILSIIEDISSRKKAEQEMETAHRMKSEFIANMTHEIRTPLNAIIGFSGILRSSTEDRNQQEYLDTVISSGNALLGLMNDILDLSKMQAGKMLMSSEPVDIKHILYKIKKIFTFQCKEKGIGFHAETEGDLPDMLLLDEIRLRQILFNLVGNAVKFTHEGYVRISVSCEYPDRGNEKISLSIAVEDTGIGIPREELKYIFDHFYQQDGKTSKRYEGIGLGLALVKNLSEMMNGTISVQSRVGKGSVFTLLLKEVSLYHHPEPDPSDFDDFIVIPSSEDD